MNEPYRLRYANHIVGAFLLVILVFGLILSLLLLRAGDHFVQHDTYWIEASQEEISELQEGAAVLILGDYAGSVQSVRYVDNSDRVRIDLRIRHSMSREIFRDSYVLMQYKFGVGTPELIIRRPPAARGPLVPLEPGSQLKSFRGQPERIDQTMAREVESVSESIRVMQQELIPTLTDVRNLSSRIEGTLDRSADPALDQTRAATESIYDTSEAVRPQSLKTLESIQAATSKLEQVVQNDVRRTLGDVRQGAAEVSRTAETLNDTAEVLNEDFAATLLRFREVIDEYEKLALETGDLVQILRKEVDQLPGTGDAIADTIDDTHELVGQVRDHWLLRRYRKTSTSTQQLSPSAVRGGLMP